MSTVRSLVAIAPRVLLSREASITAVAIALFIFFSAQSADFLTVDNMIETGRAAAFIAIVAAGWTLLLIAGELDLSVGTMYACLTVVMGWLVDSQGAAPWVAFVLILGAGAVVGLFHGLVVTELGVPSFIVTLGTLSLFQGLALVISGALPISLDPDLESSFFDVTSGNVGKVPAQLLWAVGIFLVVGALLRFTRFGAHVYATGGNEKAAREAGINTAGVKVACFVIVGMLVGLVSALTLGWLKTASPNAGIRFNLDVIAAVIIGGASLFGGAGSVYGTAVGAAILGMLTTGLVLIGFNADITYVVTGAIIVMAGALDVVLRREVPKSGLAARMAYATKRRSRRPGRGGVGPMYVSSTAGQPTDRSIAPTGSQHLKENP